MSGPTAEMVSHTSGGSEVPLLDETIGTNLHRIAARWPDADALIDLAQDVRYTYSEFDATVSQVARAFLQVGLAKGDRVGIWAPNNAEWVLIQYATARAGLIMVNINPAYRAQELQYALRQSGCRMLIAVPAFKASDYRSIISSVRGQLPALEQAVFLGTEDCPIYWPKGL